MSSLDYELGYIQAGLDLLERYLLSDEVFWPLTASPPEGGVEYPRLTLDGLLLANARMISFPMSSDQKGVVEKLSWELERFRLKWRTAWEKKAGECYRVRVRMWRDFLNEYQDNPEDNASRYRYEVRFRVMLELIKKELAQQTTAEAGLLDTLDRYLKGVFVPGEFIWEREIRGGFAPEVYWYLYGKLEPMGRH
jgi:hypothetical protein